MSQQGPDMALQMGLLTALQAAPTQEAVGVCCAYLLHCADTQPEMVRRVLRERVVREGFSGVSLLTVLTRVSM
jgi:hypothetical protein